MRKGLLEKDYIAIKKKKLSVVKIRNMVSELFCPLIMNLVSKLLFNTPVSSKMIKNIQKREECNAQCFTIDT